MSEGPKTIRVDYLARVEGEGSLTIRLEGGRATEVELGIFEPPRFFEALLRGRHYSEAPDITSRICGICPAAYLMSACGAMEDALGIEIEDPVRALRRVLYAGEWIESHALHVFMLHAPDLLGYPDSITMARDYGDWVRAGLRIKKAGNAMMEVLGGREIHPINVRVGGFYRVPRDVELKALLPELRWCRAATREAARWLAGFEFPDFERDYEFVSLKAHDEYPFCEGRIVSSKGLDIPASGYEDHFVEEHVARSNALHSRIRGRGSYVCGPLARFNLCFDALSDDSKRLAGEIGLAPPCLNPFRTLLVRMIEIHHAFEDAIAIIERYRPPAAAHRSAEPVSAVGFSATEAPRGLLYHRYRLDDEGLIVEANIVPPTAQNQLAMEDDLRELAPQLAAMPLEDATKRAEQAIRNYDPCISCATHFLRLRLIHLDPSHDAPSHDVSTHDVSSHPRLSVTRHD